MQKMRVLALMHKDLVPPDDTTKLAEEQIEPFKTEHHVVSTLERLGHEVRPLGVDSDLAVLRRAIEEFKPDIVFNILEEFAGQAVYDQNVVSYLELLRVPYTGCSPKGMVLARDKALSKKILSYHRVPVPDFVVFPIGRKFRPPKRLKYPLFVKSLIEEASLGIAQASVVNSEAKLHERVQFIHERIGTDALVEQFIEGREFYVGILGNERLQLFPIWELLFTKADEDIPVIATAKVKWDRNYQKKYGVETRLAESLPESIPLKIHNLCKRVFRALELRGYARIDLRMTPDGRIYVLEANPNPQLARDEDFAESAKAGGMAYDQLLQRILQLGMRGSGCPIQT